MVVIVVFDGVTLLDVAGAGEVFVEANRFGADYELKIASVDGRDVTSSIGTRLGVTDSIASIESADTVMVAGSDDLPRRPIDPELVEAITSLGAESSAGVDLHGLVRPGPGGPPGRAPGDHALARRPIVCADVPRHHRRARCAVRPRRRCLHFGRNFVGY